MILVTIKLWNKLMLREKKRTCCSTLSPKYEIRREMMMKWYLIISYYGTSKLLVFLYSSQSFDCTFTETTRTPTSLSTSFRGSVLHQELVTRDQYMKIWLFCNIDITGLSTQCQKVTPQRKTLYSLFSSLFCLTELPAFLDAAPFCPPPCQ